jgi:hypothetical protein
VAGPHLTAGRVHRRSPCELYASRLWCQGKIFSGHFFFRPWAILISRSTPLSYLPHQPRTRGPDYRVQLPEKSGTRTAGSQEKPLQTGQSPRPTQTGRTHAMVSATRRFAACLAPTGRRQHRQEGLARKKVSHVPHCRHETLVSGTIPASWRYRSLPAKPRYSSSQSSVWRTPFRWRRAIRSALRWAASKT